MKRFVLFIVLFSFLTLWAAWLTNAAPVKVQNSKHNLSTSGTGSIKSISDATSGTTEICVFCHTPHGGNTQAQLWNKTASLETYVTYTSDVMAGLLYYAADDPKTHANTSICLSCHDGTIALGSLVNLPNKVESGEITMEGTAGTNLMPQAAAGYIGRDLNDDHPVAIRYDAGKDPELQTGPQIKLYSKAGSDYVECTSCHNPHDNQWGNFLVKSNQNSALCLLCHLKEEFSGSIHDASTVAYAPPTGAPTAGGNPANHGPNVGNVKCMNCHFPHKSGVTAADPTTPNPTSGKYLLSFQEEASCFNDNDRFGQQNVAACHGSNAPSGRRLIKPELSSTSRHDMNNSNYDDKHKSIEVKSGTQNGWSSSVWHVECADCHNSHTAGSGVHTQGTNTISTTSALYGVAYVSVSGGYPSGSWSAPTSYGPVEPLGATSSTTWGSTPVKEYEICFKCHSYFASGGGTFPNAFTVSQQMSDQSKEFNNNNSNGSFHPVVTGNTNTWGAMVNGWNTGSQLMYCSDCHTKESLSRPQGPHGSTNKYILPYLYYDEYATPKTSPNDANGTLCLQCHDPNTYSTGGGANNTGFYTTGGTNLHTQHYLYSTSSSTSQFAYRCVNCHVRTPHGWNRKGMIVMQGDDASHLNRNWYEPANGPALISGSVSGLPASRGYAHGSANKNVDCQTVTGCHQ